MSATIPPHDSARWAEVKRVFEAALEVPREEREGYLDRACLAPTGETDADLRTAVHDLLSAEEQLSDETGTSGFLGASPMGRVLSDVGSKLLEAPETTGEPELGVGARVGPYEVERLLGRGGMGEVYLARRVDGLFDRAVALKRVREGLAPGLAERFGAERQILAGLQHPGIARLYAAGADETGRPWLAMEPVEGERLPAFAESLDRDARVGLIVQACEAVQHAHERLVVHRDIKPSNVLVTPEARVVLLDFGIAAAVGGEEGIRLLTQAYAAPEQLRGEPATTASDVYSLGVLLVETLTGARPQPSGAGASGAGPQASGGALTGDLAAVARRAMAENPADRYPTAAALADDLGRWREGRPVAARESTAVYRARRFVGRHMVSAAVAALLLLSVVGGLVATTWQAREARQAAAESEATATFLAGLFEGADPTASGDSLLALDLLQRGAARIERELAGQPGVRAGLYHVVGEAYLGLGRADSAAAFARRARALRLPGAAAADPAEAARARVLLGRALYPASPEAADGELAAAVDEARASGDPAVLLDALEARGTLAGAQVLDPAETVSVLEEAAELAARLEGETSLRSGRLAFTLAQRMASAHQHGKTEPLLRDALAQLPADAAPYDRSEVLIELAYLLNATGRGDEAIGHVDEALGIRQRLLGREDPRTADALGARAFINREDPVAAEADAREALRVVRASGAEAIEVELLNSLGATLDAQGRYDEAAEVYRQRMALVGRVLGTEGTRYAASSGNVARALHEAGRYREAAEAWDTSIRLTTETYGPESAVVASTLLAASHTDEASGDRTGALRLTERAAEASRGLDTSSVTRAAARLYLGQRLLDAGRAREAVAPLREAVEARAALDRTTHRHLEAESSAQAEALLGEALAAVGRMEEGRTWLARAAVALADARGPDDPAAARARAALDRAR